MLPSLFAPATMRMSSFSRNAAMHDVKSSSSRAVMRGAVSITTTSEPSRRKICPISSPM
jgi:hypothetical protein